MINSGNCLPPGVARVIGFEAFLASRRLRRYGYERHDVEQELLLHWLERRRHHDRRRAGLATFARHVCRHRAFTMLEAATTAKRGGSMVCSFSELPEVGADGKSIERPESISQDTIDMRLGRRSRPEAELLILRLAVHRVLATLPSGLADLARLLADGESAAEAGRKLGIAHATVYRRIAQLRAAFRAAGLGEHVSGKAA